MARILGVGIATLDIINEVDHYPAEDEELRAIAQRVVRGGNCSNTLTLLAQLGHRCDWAGVLADEPDGRRITAELERYGIDHRHALLQAGGKVPTSYITLNRSNGSRTIVHYRDLPELPFEAFARIPLAGYDWIHFEGRNVAETERMMRRCRELQPDTPVSLEVEKPREGIEALLPHADVLLYSRAYARATGHGEDAVGFLEGMRAHSPAARLYCGWGEQGGYAMAADGGFVHSPAFPPSRVVDTIGAGDSLNAGIIAAELAGVPVKGTLEYACRLAGYTCGREGLDINDFA